MGERGKEKAKKFDSRLSFLLSSVPQLFPYFLMPFSLLRFFKHGGGIGLGWTRLDGIGRYLSLPANFFFFIPPFPLTPKEE